jgi:hypothetical protein
MKSNRRSLLVAIVLLLSVAALYSQSDQTIIKHRLTVLAGGGAVNCGTIRPRSDPKPASDCVLNAFANHQPFYVVYNTQEIMIDSKFIDGLAGDKSGNLYDVEFSSGGWSSDGIPAGAQLADRKHIFVEACQKPVALRKSIYQGLTCVPRITDRRPET